MASVRLRWWGFRIRLTHREVESLTALAGATAGASAPVVTPILIAGGIAAGPAGAIAVALGLVFMAYGLWIASQDDGNGVILQVLWNGQLVWVQNPP
jgi:hypothetical protein